MHEGIFFNIFSSVVCVCQIDFSGILVLFSMRQCIQSILDRHIILHYSNHLVISLLSGTIMAYSLKKHDKSYDIQIIGISDVIAMKNKPKFYLKTDTLGDKISNR